MLEKIQQLRKEKTIKEKEDKIIDLILSDDIINRFASLIKLDESNPIAKIIMDNFRHIIRFICSEELRRIIKINDQIKVFPMDLDEMIKIKLKISFRDTNFTNLFSIFIQNNINFSLFILNIYLMTQIGKTWSVNMLIESNKTDYMLPYINFKGKVNLNTNFRSHHATLIDWFDLQPNIFFGYKGTDDRPHELIKLIIDYLTEHYDWKQLNLTNIDDYLLLLNTIYACVYYVASRTLDYERLKPTIDHIINKINHAIGKDIIITKFLNPDTYTHYRCVVPEKLQDIYDQNHDKIIIGTTISRSNDECDLVKIYDIKYQSGGYYQKYLKYKTKYLQLSMRVKMSSSKLD